MLAALASHRSLFEDLNDIATLGETALENGALASESGCRQTELLPQLAQVMTTQVAQLHYEGQVLPLAGVHPAQRHRLTGREVALTEVDTLEEPRGCPFPSFAS